MVFGYSQPQEPSRVSSLYEYVCCASWFSLRITERSPAGPCIWKVMSLPLALIRPTDSSRNCLSCWVLVPTESTRKAEPSPALSAWSAARKARLSLDLSTGGGETETGLHGDSVKNADSRIRCLLEMLAQQSHMLHYRKQWSSQYCQRGLKALQHILSKFLWTRESGVSKPCWCLPVQLSYCHAGGPLHS